MFEKDDQIVRFSLQQRILNSLLLTTRFLNDPGLLYGKMGILLVLVEYNKLYPDRISEDYIGELIEELWDDIHDELPFNFSKGLCGIGWGVEFLIHNNIIEGEGKEICAEIDWKIMQTDPRRIKDLSLENGMEGLLRYVLVHIGHALQQNKSLPFDETYCYDLFQTVNVLMQSNSKCSSIYYFIKQYVAFYSYNERPEIKLFLDELVTNVSFDENKLWDYSLGLRCGLAGILLKNMILNI